MTEKQPFAVQAAKASWIAPLVAVVLAFFGNMATPGNRERDPETARFVMLVVGSLGVVIVAIGLVLGIVALFGIKKHGTKGILIPSIVGILLSSGYFYLIVTAILAVRRFIEERGIPPQ